MAFLKNETFCVQDGAGGQVSIKTKISVSVDGEFTTRIDECFRVAAKGVLERLAIEVKTTNGSFRVSFNSLNDLDQGIKMILKTHCTPEIKEEYVIRYIIKSKISFAQNEAGDVFPNTLKEGYEWGTGDKRIKHGDLNSSNLARGGYSLTVFARALIKKTYKFGDNKKIEYTEYRQGASHLGSENPAQRLNSWRSATLPEDAKEIPYTDNGAMFFYNLIMGMAKLSKLIQDNTFNEESLLENINNNQNLLALNDDR